MKTVRSVIFLFAALLTLSVSSKAQISGNVIAYYPVPAGSCGQASFTAADSIKGSVSASGLKGGNGIYTYQWKLSTDQGTSFNAIPGAIQAAYFPGTISATSLYLREVSSGNDSSSSIPVSLYVSKESIRGNIIQIHASHLTESDIACGTSSVNPGMLTGPVPTGSSNDNYAYSWASSTDNGATFKNLGLSATAFEYLPPLITQTTWFIRIVHSGACVDSSAPVKFVYGGITGNRIAASLKTPVCGATSFTPGTIAGNQLQANYTYQWQSGPDSAHFSDISGVVTQNYDPGTLFSTTAFRRKCQTGSCSSFTNAVLFRIVPPFSSNQISISDSAGQAPVFRGLAVSAGSASINYKWEQSTDSIRYSGLAGNTDFLNYHPLAPLVSTWYRRIAFSGTCSVISNSLVLNPRHCDTCRVLIAGCSIGASKADMGVHLTRRPGDKGQGLTFDYTLSASNYGPGQATHIVIRDTLNINMNETGITAVDNGTASFDAQSRILTWTINAMRSSSIATMILSVRPANNNQLVSKVSITASQCDPDLMNNSLRDTINHPLANVSPGIPAPAFTSSIPDIITPNGDGKNDRFIISKITEPGNSNNQINIFDRWGNTVFAEKGYQNNWDGKGLSAGTYFYVLQINTGGAAQLIKGFITLMR